jgi:hypothetical protein
MAKRASQGPKEALIADLERRLEAASQAVDAALEADKEAISTIEKREALYWCAFSEMETPLLDRRDVLNTKRHYLILLAPNNDKLNMSSSVESTLLLPRELFPSKSPIHSSLEKSRFNDQQRMENNESEHNGSS